jgi:hypothetical protein
MAIITASLTDINLVSFSIYVVVIFFDLAVIDNNLHAWENCPRYGAKISSKADSREGSGLLKAN